MNSILERVNLVCKNVRVKSNESITFRKLITLTRKEFRINEIDVNIKIKKDKSLEVDHFYVMGYYDPEDDLSNNTAIELIIHHCFDSDNEFKPHHITEFLIQIFDAVVHELRHQQQSRKRNYKTYSDHTHEPFSTYLADPDELDAYSVSIAIEILRVMPVDRAKRYMTKMTLFSKMKRNGYLISPNLRAYVDYFGNNPLLKRLAKKINKHLDSLDSAQIFR